MSIEGQFARMGLARVVFACLLSSVSIPMCCELMSLPSRPQEVVIDKVVERIVEKIREVPVDKIVEVRLHPTPPAPRVNPWVRSDGPAAKRTSQSGARWAVVFVNKRLAAFWSLFLFHQHCGKCL